jgi:RHS repeat-associated protein
MDDSAKWKLKDEISFLYDGYKLIYERRKSYENEVVSEESGKNYYWVGETLLAFTGHSALPTMYYVLTDANKNVCALVSESAEVVAKYDYTPFGKLITRCLTSNARSLKNSVFFSSEYYDEETGLVYYNWRYYNPELGRWISQDPIGERGGLNLYGMVNNNPVGNWDHLGTISSSEITEIKFEEGFRACVYKDTKGKSTIGYGTNMDRVGARKDFKKNGLDYTKLLNKTLKITKKQALKMLKYDLAIVEPRIRKAINGSYKNCWNSLTTEAKDILIHMSYQMGANGVAGFTNMIKALCNDPMKVKIFVVVSIKPLVLKDTGKVGVTYTPDYKKAKIEMLDSKWARSDSPNRAQRLADRMGKQ